MSDDLRSLLSRERELPPLDPTLVLREKLAFYENQFPGFFFIQRADWSFQHIDPRVRSGLGLDPERCQRHGEGFFARIHPKDRARYWEGLLRFGEEAATRTSRFRMIDDEGNVTHHVLEVRQPRWLESGLLLGHTGVWFDVTEQAGLEAQVTFQAWQRSLGHITRILLHDFRNAMTGLQTLLELYERQLSQDHAWSEGFRLMLSTTLRTQRTVERLSQIVRDEPGEDLVQSLRLFLTGEVSFWQSLWGRPIDLHGLDEVPQGFLVEGDTTTLRRFWLQLLLLYRPMENAIERIHFDWRPVADGEWIVAEAFPFGIRASASGYHLALQPCPSPWQAAPVEESLNREWPDAEWRQIQEFADSLHLQIAFEAAKNSSESGKLHIFWPAADPRAEFDAPATTAAPASRAHDHSEESRHRLDVGIYGDWEREEVVHCVRLAGLRPVELSTPPSRHLHGLIILHREIPPEWKTWLEGPDAANHLIFIHPPDAECPDGVPDTLFTLPTRLPDNRRLLELQIQELLR